MNSVIKDIIRKDVTTEQKITALVSLEEDIQMAKRILSPEFDYCPDCDDYFLAKSFISEIEEKDEKIITYIDPINSGGNEYRESKMRYFYRVCPKGHRHKIDSLEVR